MDGPAWPGGCNGGGVQGGHGASLPAGAVAVFLLFSLALQKRSILAFKLSSFFIVCGCVCLFVSKSIKYKKDKSEFM